jgi:hypothetical protein
MKIFPGAINTLWTYETISYVSFKGSESGRMPKWPIEDGLFTLQILCSFYLSRSGYKNK